VVWEATPIASVNFEGDSGRGWLARTASFSDQLHRSRGSSWPSSVTQARPRAPLPPGWTSNILSSVP